MYQLAEIVKYLLLTGSILLKEITFLRNGRLLTSIDPLADTVNHTFQRTDKIISAAAFETIIEVFFIVLFGVENISGQIPFFVNELIQLFHVYTFYRNLISAAHKGFLDTAAEFAALSGIIITNNIQTGGDNTVLVMQHQFSCIPETDVLFRRLDFFVNAFSVSLCIVNNGLYHFIAGIIICKHIHVIACVRFEGIQKLCQFRHIISVCFRRDFFQLVHQTHSLDFIGLQGLIGKHRPESRRHKKGAAVGRNQFTGIPIIEHQTVTGQRFMRTVNSKSGIDQFAHVNNGIRYRNIHQNRCAVTDRILTNLCGRHQIR